MESLEPSQSNTKYVKKGSSAARAPLTMKTFLYGMFGTFVFVLVVFGALEFAARKVQSRRLGAKALHTEAIRDPFTAWRNNPEFGRVDVSINAEGFRRARSVSLVKPPNTIRIFLLGGSAAFGCEGLLNEIDNRFTRLYDNELIDYYLEQRLNAAFPSKTWEVINAAVNEYRLHQDLAMLESTVLRYHPDYVILLDGHNDVSGLVTSPEFYDAYASTGHRAEFNMLANPRSAQSLFFFTSTWLNANSALFRIVSQHMQLSLSAGDRKSRAGKPREFSVPIQHDELTPEEQHQFDLAKRNAGHYAHVVRQIHRILEIDGVKPLFLLQPELILSRKPLTDSEKRMKEYYRKSSGPQIIYTYEQLIPEISKAMTSTAQTDNFDFLDLTGVFDDTTEQTFSDYVHLTAVGNKKIAERVFQYFNEEWRSRTTALN